MRAMTRMWRSQGNLWELVPSLHHVGPRDGAQAWWQESLSVESCQRTLSGGDELCAPVKRAVQRAALMAFAFTNY